MNNNRKELEARSVREECQYTCASGKSLKSELENAKRQVAEYAMALDLLAKLSQSDSEKQAVDNIIEVFSLLFSPEKTGYIPLDPEGRRKNPSQHLSEQDKDPPHDSSEVFGGNFTWTASAKGFYVKIFHRGAALGIVLIDEIAFPAYKEQYLNLALSLVEVCGLAIANARKKEALLVAKEVLQHEKEKLEQALTQVRQLSGLLPICMHCKKIRDDKGYWNKIELYIANHSQAEFSHGICEECLDTYYPE